MSSFLSRIPLRDFHRSASRRSDPELLQRNPAPKEILYLPLWDDLNLFSPLGDAQAVVLGKEAVGGLGGDVSAVSIYLGETPRSVFFALCLSAEAGFNPEALSRYGSFLDLRKALPVLDSEQFSLLAFAKSLAYWQGRALFCGACGAGTRAGHGGHVRTCSNETCARQYFPRTDPAIIVLVLRGERCLLGRQSSWLPGRYSVLAGFVEPGEALEEAVIREVEEETGVRVRDVRYHSSQPWPFPSSLMIGFTARALDDRIDGVPGELEDARWFSRKEIAGSLRDGSLVLPPRASIANRLITEWYDAGESLTLNDLLESLPHRQAFR